MSSSLLDLERRNFNLPDCAAFNVRTGYGNSHAEVDGPYIHRVKASRHCEEWRKNERGNKGNKLDKHCRWYDCWRRDWMVYLSKVWFSLSDSQQVLIRYRTVARSQQLEAEERNDAHRSTSQVPGAFTDDPEEQEAAATLLRDDQIDFLDTESSRGRYQDEFSDDDDHDPFRNGDGGDEQGGINLEHQPPHR